MRFALLCSIFIHGLLLAWGVARIPSPEGAPEAAPSVNALHAQLRMQGGRQQPLQTEAPRQMLPQQPDAARPVAVRPKAAPSREQVAHGRTPRLRMPVEKATPLAAAGEKLVAPDVTVAQPTGVPRDARAATAGFAASVRDAGVGETAAEQKSAPPAVGASADGLRRYRLNLAVEARNFKRYPAQARAAGWVGTVAVFLSVDAEGRVGVSVNKSSGYGALDEAGCTMIEASAQRTPVPDVLRGKAFSLVIPVVFDLNDG